MSHTIIVNEADFENITTKIENIVINRDKVISLMNTVLDYHQENAENDLINNTFHDSICLIKDIIINHNEELDRCVHDLKKL